jgi:hypothetical protein
MTTSDAPQQGRFSKRNRKHPKPKDGFEALRQVFLEERNRTCRVTERGRVSKVTTQRLADRQTINQAMSGDLAAGETLLKRLNHAHKGRPRPVREEVQYIMMHPHDARL